MVSTRLEPALSSLWVPAQSLGPQVASAPTNLAPAGPPPREGLNVAIALPEAKRGGGQLPGGRTTEQLVHFLLEASPPHPRHSRPYPAGLPLHSRLACLSGAPPRPRLGSGSSQRHPLPH